MEHRLFDFYNNKTERVVLASGSPRRRELLEQAGLKNFEVITAEADEGYEKGTPPHTVVMLLSAVKAGAVAEKLGDFDLVIGADTVVCLEGEIMGKPENEEKAREMLRKLSGRCHSVFTGITLRRGDMEITDYEETKVFFRELSDREIDAYIATGEPMDKAGAYGIQGAACSFCERLEGDYYNVVGLPVSKLCTLMKLFGVEVL